MKSFLLAFMVFCASCAPTYDVKRDRVDSVSERGTEREQLKKGSIRVHCLAAYAGDPVPAPTGCAAIRFSLRNAEGEEIDAKYPSAEGRIEFRVTEDQKYQVIAQASEVWKVSQKPSGMLRADDQVDFLLSR